METGVRYARAYGLARSSVEKKGGGGKCFSPKGLRKMSLKHERAHCVIDGTNGALKLTVLLGGIWTRETECRPVLGEKFFYSGVKKLSSTIHLKRTYGGVEVGANISVKICKCTGHTRFLTQRKGPIKVRIIIENHKVISKTRITNYW
jgi:hypothetical protein